MTTTVWFDPSFGASGDMTLGAFASLGVSIDDVREMLSLLGVDGWTLHHETVQRCGLASHRVSVTTTDAAHHRAWTTIDELIASSALPTSVRNGARESFRRLATVEAAQHGMDIDEVHFHEVGAIDAIVDICGAWAAWHLMGEPTVQCGPFGFGYGTVKAAHGLLPLPAPATAALLSGAPVHHLDFAGETVTPTGAAILVTMAEDFGPLPAGRLLASGRGAGGRDPESHPNVLSVHLIETSDATFEPRAAATSSENAGAVRAIEAVVLETNLDDLSGEHLGAVMVELLEAGAHDVWFQPIVMKKSRPAVTLSVLVAAKDAQVFTHKVMAATGTLGVREQPVRKHLADRSFRRIEIDGHCVNIKVGPFGVKPEHDDIVALASATGRTFRQAVQVVSETLASLAGERA